MLNSLGSKMIENKPVKVSAVIAGKTLEIFIYKSTPTMTKPIKSISINSDKNTVSNRQNVTFTLSAKYSDDTDVEDSVLKDAIWTSENTMLKLTSSIGKIAVGAYLYITTINKGYADTQAVPLLKCVPLKVNVNLKGLTGSLTIDGIPTGDLNLESTRPIEYLAVNTTTKFYYDTNGNLIKKVQEQAGVEKSLEEYSYNVLNQLKSYKNNTTGKAATYNYFVDGLRKSKVVNGTTTNYYNDGSNVIIETDGNNNLTARNIIGIKNIGRQESNGIINYFLYNAHGDITQLIGNTGEIVNSYEYDIYGKAKDSTEKIKNPIRYAGQYYDEESGLYYLRARYYSPDIMRFISEDPIEAGQNWYTYCLNNPVKYYDPSGNVPVETVFDIASVGVSAAAFIKNPSWASAAFLAWDLIAVAVPYVPGSYVAKGVKVAGKVNNVFDSAKLIHRGTNAFGNLSRASKYGVESYSALLIKLKRSGLQAHHVVEKRLADILGISNSNLMLSVAVTKSEHQLFTNAWRQYIPYGTNYMSLSKDYIWNIAQKVYKNYPTLLEAAKKTICP